MKVIDAGHVYELDDLKSDTKTDFNFHMDPKIHPQGMDGPSCQEVLRMLIDRVEYLDREKFWGRNAEIIQHLRQAILLFEIRALELKVVKGQLAIEDLEVGSDGHIKLSK